MKILELEVAGEYLVMAATLMAIKSQMLLPKQELIAEVEEYEEDPRDMLVAQLLEYRKFKYAAEQLSEKAEERSLYYTKDPMDVDEYKEEEDQLRANQFNTIQLEMQHVSAKKGRSFDSFFTSYNKTEVVVTFMALLELMKKGTIRVEQTDNYASILLYPTGKEDE